MAAMAANQEPSSDIVLVGDEEDVRGLCKDILDEQFTGSEKLKKCFESWLRSEFDFGMSQIEQCKEMVDSGSSAILVLTKRLLYSKDEEKTNLYNLIFTWARLRNKPRVAVLIDMVVSDLPIGLKNVRGICLKTDEPKEKRFEKLKKIESLLQESKLEISKLGNISQGQAFSNFFGFFKIIFEDDFLKKSWAAFERVLPSLTSMTKSSVPVKIFLKFVEIILPDGPNPRMEDLGFENVEQIFTSEDDRKKVNKIGFTRSKARCGADSREYPARLYRVCNGNQAILFTGQIAPSGNVFHKLTPGEKGRKHRRCYARTSQEITDHPKNKACNGNLLVLEVEDKNNIATEVFHKLDEHLKAQASQVSELNTPVIHHQVKKCHIINDGCNEIAEEVRMCLKTEDVEVVEHDMGGSKLCSIDSDVDLCILLVDQLSLTEDQLSLTKDEAEAEAAATDWQTQCSALLPHSSVLVMKHVNNQEDKSWCEKNIEMLPFTKQHQSIDEGLSVTYENLQQKLSEYIRKGPKELLDLLMISNLYIGLAQAFVCNYLKNQREKLEVIANGKGAMLKLYELVPKSGDCSDEKLMNIEAKREKEAKVIKDGRPFVTPMFSKNIIVDGQDHEVSFFMEYCTPIQVLFEMHESDFGNLLTEEDKRTEIHKFIMQMEILLREDDELNNIVTVIPLGEKEDWETKVTEIIRNDVKEWLKSRK